MNRLQIYLFIFFLKNYFLTIKFQNMTVTRLLVNLIYQFGFSGKLNSFSKSFIFCLFVQKNETTANNVISTLRSWWARFHQVQRMIVTHIICTEKMLSHQWNFTTILINLINLFNNFNIFFLCGFVVWVFWASKLN